MSQSEKLAIAAHLHVLLRRKTGRVTDTEWMASNGAYAREVIRFARERAQQDQAPELADWADKLEACMQDVFAAEARRTAREVAAAAASAAARTAERTPAVVAEALASLHPQARRYVGGIR
ncbi:hypothetical protein ACDW_04330 [Acidovorax sp. DW039]|uniref:hypothetical protein n=1 Tax=Acidovorax sp. DW039 TaxID=3095606 RepID=UPI00308BEF76|nr:hypothetical protein ACDW_04330 [Acidovorax sp. DW039]